MVIDAYWATSPKRSVELYERSITRHPDIFLTAPFAMAHAGVAYARIGREEEAVAEFKGWKEANPAIKLDHYTEYFKGYHVDKSIGAELSATLLRFKEEFIYCSPE